MGENHINPQILDMKHTPGLWIADGYYVRQSGISGTRMIADVCYTGPHHTPPDEYPKSCRFADEANAQLIAAAPELLEALISAQGFLNPLSGLIETKEWDHLENVRDKMRSAIAKATGEK